jgi:hypothetical protein
MARKHRALHFFCENAQKNDNRSLVFRGLKDYNWPKEKTDMDAPVVFLHGFSEKVLFEVVQAVKDASRKAGIDPGLIAFASSTPTNLNWKLKDLIREVREEHQMMR